VHQDVLLHATPLKIQHLIVEVGTPGNDGRHGLRLDKRVTVGTGTSTRGAGAGQKGRNAMGRGIIITIGGGIIMNVEHWSR